MAAKTAVENHPLDEVRALAIDILPNKPAREARAGNGFHLDGEHIEVAILIEVRHPE